MKQLNTDVDLLEGQDKALCKHVKNRVQQLSMQDKVQHMHVCQ